MSELNPTITIDQPCLRQALEQVRPKLATLEEADLLQIHIDPLTAAATVQGALPQIMAFRSQIVADLPNFDITLLDNLTLYSLALIQAHTLQLGANTPPEVLAKLVEEGIVLRGLLLADAEALAKRGYISAIRIDELKGIVGYKNVASDLLTITNMIRSNWPTVASKTGVTEAELDRAEVVGTQLINAIGIRELAPATAASVTLERQQTYTLLVNAYDQVRRVICFVRWDEDDADSIAPSLFAGRNTPRKKNQTEVAPQTATTLVSAPALTTVATPAAATDPIVAKVAPGLPGADPFLR